MASKKIEDFRSFDWDDSALIRAYNRGTKIREQAIQDAKKAAKSKNGNSSKENVKDDKQWRKGDYCKVKYFEDSKMYEAIIDSIHDGVATVKFLGYNDEQLVRVTDLKESGGKRSRRRQLDDAQGGYSTASESFRSTPTDRDSGDRRKHNKHHENASFTDQNAVNPTEADNSYMMPANPPQLASNPPQLAPNPPQLASNPPQLAPNPLQLGPSHPQLATNQPHGAMCYAPTHVPHSVPTSMPFLPAPPAPPMPQCPSVAQNPSLSAMLVSWYMAGYYTGLNQAQSGHNGCQCSQHCCNRSNRCCH